MLNGCCDGCPCDACQPAIRIPSGEPHLLPPTEPRAPYRRNEPEPTLCERIWGSLPHCRDICSEASGNIASFMVFWACVIVMVAVLPSDSMREPIDPENPDSYAVPTATFGVVLGLCLPIAFTSLAVGCLLRCGGYTAAAVSTVKPLSTLPEYFRRMRGTKPRITFHIECYHTYTTGSGDNKTTHRATTHTEDKEFQCPGRSMRCLIQDDIHIPSEGVIRVSNPVIVYAEDEATRQELREQYTELYERNRFRDSSIEGECRIEMEGHQREFLAVPPGSQPPSWLDSSVYTCMTILCMPQLFYILYRCRTSSFYVPLKWSVSKFGDLESGPGGDMGTSVAAAKSSAEMNKAMGGFEMGNPYARDNATDNPVFGAGMPRPSAPQWHTESNQMCL